VTLPGSGGIVTFKYDPLGRRIEKVTPAGTLRYVYDNEDIIAVLDSNNSVTQTITHGPGIDEPLIMKSSTSANYYYHADGLGSIIALSNDSAETVETYEYQAYGKPTIKDHASAVFDASPVGNLYLFTGREYDNVLALYYLRARYYSPMLGQFVNEDPLGLLGGINLYEYGKSNPIGNIDPFGLKCVKPFWARVADNVAQTNRVIPGILAPPFFGSAIWVFTGTTMGASVANTAGLVTLGQWVKISFGGATVGAATFTSIETGLLVGVNVAYAWVLTGLAFEGGVVVGSIINTLITPCEEPIECK
jgi:RHS repeat-associated protein